MRNDGWCRVRVPELHHDREGGGNRRFRCGGRSGDVGRPEAGQRPVSLEVAIARLGGQFIGVRDASAGASYSAAASALETHAERIARHTQMLSQHWDGTAADTALACMRHSREQALDAAARAKRTGATLTWLGSEILPVFRSLPDPAAQPDAHAVASRYLAALDDYLKVAAKAITQSAPDT
jgi:hypothetical protein